MRQANPFRRKLSTGVAVMGDGMEVLSPPKGASGKKGQIEDIYQKKTQLEHILLRPDTYIGKHSTLFKLN